MWVAFLLAVIGIGFLFYLRQMSYGLGITGMGRDVSWGLYIANFTFLVGMAASAVVVVLPYYLHHQKEFEKLTTLGEFLAVSSVMMSMLFVFVDLGQPGRGLNLILYPQPHSVMFWDLIALSVYLLLNITIGWSVLDSKLKEEPTRAWVKPLILLSIPWAVSIHTVTAFLYSGLGGRTFWLTALLAPRFLATAFAAGPAVLVLVSLIMKRLSNFDVGSEARQKVVRIVTYALLVHLFFLVVEAFTVYYSGIPEDLAHFNYLLFGLQGNSELVPWIWASYTLAVAAVVLLLNPGTRKRDGTLAITCVLIFAAVWIDKGLGLMVPGFVPSPTGTLPEYVPTLPEILITLGVWAAGLLVLTGLYKIATSAMSDLGHAKHEDASPLPAAEPATSAPHHTE